MKAKVWLGAALIACALYQAVLELTGHPFGLVLTGGLITMVLAVGTVVQHGRQAWRSSGPARRAWMFAAAAIGMWAMATVCYTADVLGGVTAPPARLGDWFSLGSAALAPGVLMAGPSAPVSWGARVRLLLDGFMIATALFVPAWPLLLRPTAQTIGSTGGLIAAGIPAIHIICLSVAIVLLSRSRARAANAVTALAGSFGGFAVVVLTYLAVALNGGSWQVHSMAGAFAATTVLLGYAAGFPMPVSGRPWLEAPTGARAALPYVPVLGAFGMAAFLQQRQSLDTTLVTALLVMISLIILRQFLALRSNASLLAEVEEQRRLLAHQATHDDLTGLGNRKLLHARTTEAVASELTAAVLLIDLDGFKQVNDRWGHGAGDDVLVRVAAALHRAVPAEHLVTRLGGDEFAILFHPAPDRAVVLAVAERIIDEITNDAGPQVGASVGAAFKDDDRRTVAAFLAEADAAMYRAKAAGKGVVAGLEPVAA